MLPGTYEIQLLPGNYVLSIPGTGEDAGATGDLDIDPPPEIRGASAGSTRVSGGGLDRVFDIVPPLLHVDSGIDATLIRNLTITGGDAGAENGGGVMLRGMPPVNMVETWGVRKRS